MIVWSRFRVLFDATSTTSSGTPRMCSGTLHAGRTLARQIQKIRLDDIEVRDDDVERREKHFADRIRLEVIADGQVQLPQDPLVAQVGRWRHVVHPVDQLVPLPVVWETARSRRR